MGEHNYLSLKTAELWDPMTGAWTDLPPMPRQHGHGAHCCVLPSGRIAVVGGWSDQPLPYHHHADVFDPEARTWTPLPSSGSRASANSALRQLGNCGVAPVAGGLVAITWYAPKSHIELFDEESGRWFVLPHPMAELRRKAVAVSVPVAALTLPAAGAAAGAAGE